MHRLVVTLLISLCGCAQVASSSDARAASDATAFSDAQPDAVPTADTAPAPDVCTSFARPTGRCTSPGVCCVSSTCVMGICR